MGFSWDLGIDGDIGNIQFSWSVSGLGISGSCPVQLEFDIFNPSDSIIDRLAVPDFKITPNCPELETHSQDFFVDSRSVSNNVCHVTCYDRMSRTDADFSTSHNWKTEKTMSAHDVLTDICRICGFESSSISGGVGGGLQYINFTQSDVTGKTCGEILDTISEIMLGVWVCSYTTLFLVTFGNSMNGTIVNSKKYTEIEYQGRTQILGLVMKTSSDGKTYSFGTTTGNGYVIQVENGLISAELANVVWQRIKNFQYIAWNCEKADITTPKFSFGGLLQFIYSQDVNNVSNSLDPSLFPRNVRYYVDSTGIYFSGGCAPCDEWNYQSKLEREKIGIGKAVGNMSVDSGGRINYFDLN